MRGLGTVLKSLDRSNSIHFRFFSFTIVRMILSTSTRPIAVLVLPCIAGILCRMAFYAEGLRVCTSSTLLSRRLQKRYVDIEKHKISR